MNKKTIACFFGGCSSEYEVSLVSASAVIQAINLEKYDVLMVGITRKGDFYLYEGAVDKIEQDQWFDLSCCKKITISTNRSDHGMIILDEGKIIPIDLAFPILHGRNGEDGRLQGLLELAGIKIIGCQMTSSVLCMDKFLAHELVKAKGIEVPKSYLFHSYDKIDKIKENIASLSYPIFVKPLKAGSSFGITKVESESQLSLAMEKAFEYDQEIIIEQNIEGFEVGCAILGNEELIIGEVDEIELQDGFFDFSEKYNLTTSKIHLPARLPQEERNKIKETALSIYQILRCKGFARVDMFYTKEGKIVFNEVNTIPGCTSHSRYPNMMQKVGYSFQDMIEKWIELECK